MVCNGLGIVLTHLSSVGLNPYSTGIWSATLSNYDLGYNWFSLNPYSTGIWSATLIGLLSNSSSSVLILILLEYGLQPYVGSVVKVEFVKGLNPYSTGIWSATRLSNSKQRSMWTSLNPYSTGIWSATYSKK